MSKIETEQRFTNRENKTIFRKTRRASGRAAPVLFERSEFSGASIFLLRFFCDEKNEGANRKVEWVALKPQQPGEDVLERKS